jgi:phage/plasmid-like protein (TIGR03299 family)
MAHLIETMFSVREKPWHYAQTSDVTKIIQEAPTSKDALIAAGLDWIVESKPVCMESGIVIPGYKANVRDKDNKCLGIVSERYKIVQNDEAFEFTDALVGETEFGEVRYETAGSLNGGKKIWLLAKMPTRKILDDDIEPYICFANSFDGSGAVQVCATPVRVVCANTLNIALNSAKRKWSTKHVGDMQSKLEEARMCLQLTDKYMQNLDIEADRLANATLYKEQIDEILDELFPITDNDSDRKKQNVQSAKDNFYVAYFMPDILKFGESAWRAVNAMSDFVTHSTPKRNTKSYNENRWGKIMDGHAIMDQFVELVNKKISV